MLSNSTLPDAALTVWSHSDDSYPGGPIFRAVPYNYFGGKPYALCENVLPGNLPILRTRHYQNGINTGVNSNWHALARFHPAANRCKEHSSRVGRNYFIYLIFINLLKKPN